MLQETFVSRLLILEGKDAERNEKLFYLDQLIEETKLSQEKLTRELAENTKITKEIKELLDLGKSFFTFMKYIGIAAKWLTVVGAAVAAILHFGAPPTGK